jgi:hypothetical protein
MPNASRNRTGTCARKHGATATGARIWGARECTAGTSGMVPGAIIFGALLSAWDLDPALLRWLAAVGYWRWRVNAARAAAAAAMRTASGIGAGR